MQDSSSQLNFNPPLLSMKIEEPFTPMRLTNSSDVVSADVSSVWSLLPEKTESLAERPAALASIADAAAYGQNPYYNYTAAANYSMYSGNAWQAAASRLNPNFPYAIGSTTTPAATASYYGNSYPTGLNFGEYAYSTYYGSMRQGYYPTSLPAAYGASLAGDAATDFSFALKDKKPATKSSKKKKSGSCSPGEAQFTRVFIWDMDVICSCSEDALKAAGHRMDDQMRRHARLLQSLIHRVVQLCFPGDMEDCEIPNVEDAAQEETAADTPASCSERGDALRRVANRFYALRQLYQDCSSKDGALFERLNVVNQKAEFEIALRDFELYFARGDVARRCLDLVRRRSGEAGDKYANVVIARENVAKAAAALLLCGFGNSVPLDNIYSFEKAGKDAVLDRIQSRYGKKCSFFVVSNNLETHALAKKAQMPIWQTVNHEGLEKLHNAEYNFLLGNPTPC